MALVIVPSAATWTTSTGPPGALAGLALAALVCAAVHLLVMDSRSEMRSRAEWDAIGVTPTAMMPPKEANNPGLQYPTAVYDEALHALLRIHRQAYPRQRIGERHCPDRHLCRVPQDATATTARKPPTLPSRDEAGRHNAELGPVQNAANDMHTGLVVVRSCAPMKSAGQGKRTLGRSARLRLRRVVNASADTPGSGSTRRLIGIPIKIASDIVVLGQDRKEPFNRDGFHQANLDGGVNERQFTPSRRIRLRSHPKTTVDEAALAEARRKVIALAEELARQAAREDDAAEQAKERSTSEDVDTSGNRRGRDGNDETG